MNIETKIGDVFSVPLHEDSFVVGVVASQWKSELYLIIFKERFESPEEFEACDFASLTPLFASSSLDAKIWHGHWPIIRRGTDILHLAQPIYKVEEPSGTVAESFDRERRVVIGGEAAQRLEYRKGVSPVRLENAIKAFYEIRDWDLIFEDLRYDVVLYSNEVLIVR